MFTDVEIRKIEDLTAKYGRLRYYIYFWDKLMKIYCRAGDFLSEKQIETLKEEGSRYENLFARVIYPPVKKKVIITSDNNIKRYMTFIFSERR